MAVATLGSDAAASMLQELADGVRKQFVPRRIDQCRQ
jgi:hypothetical protein